MAWAEASWDGGALVCAAAGDTAIIIISIVRRNDFMATSSDYFAPMRLRTVLMSALAAGDCAKLFTWIGKTKTTIPANRNPAALWMSQRLIARRGSQSRKL